MKILHLTLKKKWFDMILSGEKREEYREIKPYWEKRLRQDYNAIEFRNGYRKDSPKFLIECGRTTIGTGLIEWGAPHDKYIYIIRLGKILTK